MRLLFVDDEPSIRATMPTILRQEGFEVSIAANVAEGLDLIQHENFDVLLTDLNIGNPGDGFMLVSAMRRLQPEGKTFILTGYPDFETALQAIRKQVDDYFVKPADIPSLVRAIKERLVAPRRLRDEPPKRVSEILREFRDRIVEIWLARAAADDYLSSLEMSIEDRIGDIPAVIELLADNIERPDDMMLDAEPRIATAHGQLRAQQGYSATLLVKETNILAKILSEVIQENLLIADLSTLVPDVLKIGVCVNVLLEESLAAFLKVQDSAA